MIIHYYNHYLHTGRPYGGTAILWKKSIDASSVVNYDSSIIGIKVNLGESYLILVNVCLPYSCSTNVDAYLQYLSKLQNFCEEFGCNVSIIGDFNASEQNLIGPILSSFCVGHGYVQSDKLFLPNNSYTYVSEVHGSTSWLDHCLSSTAVHDSIGKISVVYDCISLDYHPLSISYVCSKLPNISVKSLNFKWASVSEDEKQAYFQETEMRMLNLKSQALQFIAKMSCVQMKCMQQKLQNFIKV